MISLFNKNRYFCILFVYFFLFFIKDVFFDKGKIIPFNLVDSYGHKYLFLADENDDISNLLAILNDINCDFNLLKTVSDIDIVQKFGQVEFAQYFYVKGRTCMA